MWPHWGFNITGDRCCAAKPSPDGPTRGLTSIYEACWHNLPLTGFWALLKESVPLKRVRSLVSSYPYVVLFFLPLQGCTLWCFLQSMKSKACSRASFWGFCLLNITHFLIYHEPFDLQSHRLIIIVPVFRKMSWNHAFFSNMHSCLLKQ